MYLLFRDKNITPAQYMAMTPGEQLVLRAFAEEEIDERKGR